MANSKYWADMFMKGAGEACAISFLSHIEYIAPIHEQMNEVLVKIGTDRLAELTEGSSSKEKVVKLVVRRLSYVNRCIDKLGAGFMDDMILEGLHIRPDESDNTKRYSYILEEEIVKIMTKRGYLEETWWWKMEKSPFISACRKISLINKVHES